jgi:hypothetical protein
MSHSRRWNYSLDVFCILSRHSIHRFSEQKLGHKDAKGENAQIDGKVGKQHEESMGKGKWVIGQRTEREMGG